MFPRVGGRSGHVMVSGATTPILLQDSHLSLSPNPVNFGEVQLGASKGVTVTFADSGTDATEVTGLSVGGTDSGDFSVVSSSLTCQQDTSGFVVPASGSCSVEVAFAPTATGDRSAAITVLNSSSDGTQTLALTGTGINLVLSASPGPWRRRRGSRSRRSPTCLSRCPATSWPGCLSRSDVRWRWRCCARIRVAAAWTSVRWAPR